MDHLIVLQGCPQPIDTIIEEERSRIYEGDLSPRIIIGNLESNFNNS